MKENIAYITGVNGGGKSTLERDLETKYGHCFTRLVSTTTRPPREGEINGVDYYFVTKEEFLEREMMEVNDFGENLYGLERKEFERRRGSGKTLILVADPNGIAQVKDYIKARNLPFKETVIALNPSKETIVANLQKGGYDEEEIRHRIQRGNIIEDIKKRKIYVSFTATVLDKATTDIAAAAIRDAEGLRKKYLINGKGMTGEEFYRWGERNFASESHSEDTNAVVVMSPFFGKSANREIAYRLNDTNEGSPFSGTYRHEDIVELVRTISGIIDGNGKDYPENNTVTVPEALEYLKMFNIVFDGYEELRKSPHFIRSILEEENISEEISSVLKF